MNEDEFRQELASLPRRRQIAVLACCIEHVIPICGQNETLQRALALAWTSVAKGTIDHSSVGLVVKTFDTSIDEDSDSDLLYVSAAVELLLMSLDRLEPKTANQILNNIEAAIYVADPDPKLGALDEQRWQVSVLRRAIQLDEPSLVRASFAALVDERAGWYHRLERDGWL